MAEPEHIVFVDDEINSNFLVIGAVRALHDVGYIVWGASSRGETIQRVSELQAKKIIAAIAIIDGFGGRGGDIAEILEKAFPNIKTLAFSYEKCNFGDDFLPKQAVEEANGMKWLVQAVQGLTK